MVEQLVDGAWSVVLRSTQGVSPSFPLDRARSGGLCALHNHHCHYQSSAPFILTNRCSLCVIRQQKMSVRRATRNSKPVLILL